MKYKIIILFIFCPFFESSTKQSVGLRLGEAFCHHYKDFISDEFSLWRSCWDSGSVKVETVITKRDRNNPPNSSSFYIHMDQKRYSPLMGEWPLTYHEDINRISLVLKQGYLLAMAVLSPGSELPSHLLIILAVLTSKIHPNPAEVSDKCGFRPEAFCRCEYLF